MTTAPTLTPIRLSLAEARFIESEEINYHEYVAWRWRQIDLAAENLRMHRAVHEFGRARRDQDRRALTVWSGVILLWLIVSLLISRGMPR